MERDNPEKYAVMGQQLLAWAKARGLACPEHPGQLRADPMTMRVQCGATERSCPWQASPPPDIAAAVEAYASLAAHPSRYDGNPYTAKGTRQPGNISDFGKVCIGVIVALVVFFIAFYVMAEIKTPDSTIDIIGGKDIPDGPEGK